MLEKKKLRGDVPQAPTKFVLKNAKGLLLFTPCLLVDYVVRLVYLVIFPCFVVVYLFFVIVYIVSSSCYGYTRCFLVYSIC